MTQIVAEHLNSNSLYDSKTLKKPLNSYPPVLLEAAKWYDGVNNCQGQSSAMNTISPDLCAGVFPQGLQLYQQHMNQSIRV